VAEINYQKAIWAHNAEDWKLEADLLRVKIEARNLGPLSLKKAKQLLWFAEGCYRDCLDKWQRL
jgi:hypothetical protein